MKLFARIAALIVTLRALRSARKDPAPGSVGPTPYGETSAAPALKQPTSVRTTTGPSQQDPQPDQAPTTEGAAGADTPLDLEASDWKQTVKRTLKEIKDDRVTLIAAGMAFYFFLAVFPAIIALVGILGLAHAPELAETIRDGVDSTLPGGAGEVLASAFDNPSANSESGLVVAALIGVAASLWSASSGFVALQSGLNIAYEIDEDRKFIGKRAVALLLIILTGLLGGVPSPFFSFGDTLVFTIIGWALTFVAVVILFSAYYALGPKKETPGWRWVSPGGLVGAVLWILASSAFSFYANLGSYDKTYGALAGVIILIFWLYLSSIAILVGGELNSELERQTKTKPDTV